MTVEQGTLKPIYVSDNKQFSSLNKKAVERWEKLRLDKNKLSSAERNLWNCKGNINKEEK